MYEPSADEQYMLELMNAERAKVGAQPLAFDFDLNEAAERWREVDIPFWAFFGETDA